MKTLIITEKPSVAREYAEILKVRGKAAGRIEDDRWVITWCVGHLVEMCYPEKYDQKYAKWKLEDLPFLPEDYRYEVIRDVKDQYQIVKEQLHRTDIGEVLYAGDSGREGEVIIELIRRQSGVRQGMRERRVWIDSCTEEEILRGIREARPIEDYDRLAEAGILRSIEDYAMGINFSRALSVKYARMVNAEAQTKKYAAIAIGRVMTCVLGMVVERERQIRSFQETVFQRIIGTFETRNGTYTGEWKAGPDHPLLGTKKLYKDSGFLSKEDADAFLQKLSEEKTAVVEKAEKSVEKKKPPLLFNLAELQAECSRRFKISPDQTLKVAQDLYEKKFTTYPRTDARVLSTAIAGEIGKNLKGLTGYAPTAEETGWILSEGRHKSLAKTPYADDSKITDHYAIIPTGQTRGAERLSPLEKDVYDLIVRRFLSIFYPPAQYRKAQIVTLCGGERFFTNVRVLKDPGYLAVAPKTQKKDEEGGSSLLAVVEALRKNTKVTPVDLSKKEGKTTPPKRYTSGTMVLAMENAGQLIEDEDLRGEIKGSGIGTSATRAGIIEKLVKNGYLSLQKKTQVLTPARLGEMVYEVVAVTLHNMLRPEMTASWERGLSQVEGGQITGSHYREVLETYVRKHIEAIRSQDMTAVIRERIRKNCVS